MGVGGRKTPFMVTSVEEMLCTPTQKTSPPEPADFINSALQHETAGVFTNIGNRADSLGTPL